MKIAIFKKKMIFFEDWDFFLVEIFFSKLGKSHLNSAGNGAEI